MKPVHFDGVTTIYAKDQPQYEPLPAQRLPGGVVLTCWAPTWRERLALLFGGRIWHHQIVGRDLLQPVFMTTNPLMRPRVG